MNYLQPMSIPLSRTIVLITTRLLLLALLAAWLVPASRDTAHASDTVEFLASDAQPDFPENITFSLTVESSDAEITEIELLYGATRSDTLTIVPVTFTPGQRIEVEHLLNTQIYHLPVGVELTYRWIVRDAEGGEFESPAQELLYLDDRFKWQQRSERGVTVHWYEGGSGFGDELIQTSTHALDRLQEEIGATVEEPVNIYIYANPQDMRAALQSNEVEWVGGQAVPGLGLILAAIAPGDTPEVRRIVPHELSHQVLAQAIDNPYGGLPLWFEEGLAVYNQETADRIFPMMLREAALTDQLIPLEALAASFPADPNQALLSYAQSYSVVDYIIDTYGTDKLAELVDTFDLAIPVEEAIPEVLNVSLDELDAEWRETLPPAEESVNRQGGPSVAPADRFQGEPVLPLSSQAPAAPATAPTSVSSAAQVPPPPTAPDTPPVSSLLPGLGLPLWIELALVGTTCIGTVVVMGMALLVTLRLTRAGNQD